MLADQVGEEGRVIASDIDISRLAERQNLDVLRHDVMGEDPPREEFDLIHARFLLEHLEEPEVALRKLAAALTPGGWLVVEDAAGLDFSVLPEVGDLARVSAAWEEAASSVGWDPLLGHSLLSMAAWCGLENVEGLLYRRQAAGGKDWDGVRLGLVRLAGAIIRRGVGEKSVSRALAALDDPSVVVTGPAIMVVGGQAQRNAV